MALNSEVQICNSALVKIGVTNLIGALTEETEEAVACNQLYEQVRDEVTRDHFWNFAVTFASLTADAVAPSWGYAHSYTLPTDCLRFIGIKGSPAYQLTKDRKIFTDEAAPLYIMYVAQVTTVADMDITFKRALVTRLAAELCMSLTKDLERNRALLAEYSVIAEDARFFDSTEGSQASLAAQALINARFQGPDAIQYPE